MKSHNHKIIPLSRQSLPGIIKVKNYLDCPDGDIAIHFAEEANKRIKYPLLYISTLHHLGTRECNIDTNTQLLKDRKWKQFTSQSQICRGMKFETKKDLLDYYG